MQNFHLKIKFASKIFFILLCLITQNILAELPLTVENIITDKNKFKLNLSLIYRNLEQQGVQASDYVSVKTGSNSFVNINVNDVNVPSKVGQTQTNSDILIASLGVRYGLNDFETYLRANYLKVNRRITDLSGTSSNSYSKLLDTWMGINYQFSDDTDTMALFGSIETAVYEKYTTDSARFKSHQIGLTAYRAIDPIVLSLTGGYRFNQTRKNNKLDYKPGNFFFISPSVDFAVNDTITLTTGFQWLNMQPSKEDNITQDMRSTSTDLILGMAYGQTENGIINTTLNTNISGRGGADLRVDWLYSF